MNRGQFKNPVSHLCLADTVVASWSLTQKVAGSNPFAVLTNILVTEFSEFSESWINHLGILRTTAYFSFLLWTLLHFLSKQRHSTVFTDFQKLHSTCRRQRALRLILHKEGKETFIPENKFYAQKARRSSSTSNHPTRPSKGIPDIPVILDIDPFQAILHASRDSTLLQHSPIRMLILHSDWFTQKLHRVPVEALQTYILQRKGDVALLAISNNFEILNVLTTIHSFPDKQWMTQRPSVYELSSWHIIQLICVKTLEWPSQLSNLWAITIPEKSNCRHLRVFSCLLLHLYINYCDFHSKSLQLCTAMYPDIY